MAIFGTSWDDPQTQAMLALGAGLLGSKGSFGQALGAGASGAMQAYQQAIQAKQEAEQREQMRQVREMEMEAMRRQQAAAEAAAARQARAQGIMGGAFRPQTDAGSFLQNTMGGDYMTPSASKMPNMQGGLQQAQAQLMAQGMIPEALALQEQIAKLAPKLEKAGSGDRLYDPVTNKVVLDALPDLVELNLGGSTVLADKRNPQNADRSFKRTMTPGEAATNSLGWANYNLSGERLRFDKEKDVRDSLQSVTVDGQPYVFNKRTGQYSQGRDPAGGNIVQDKEKRGAESVLTLIGQAESLIDQSTGSYIGAGIDQLGRVIGKSTDGAEAIGKLRAVEGALIAKMPRMEGPQSDRDSALYRQAAGMIADPTLPAEVRKAGLQMVKEIQQRYAGRTPDSIGGRSWDKPGGGWSATEIR